MACRIYDSPHRCQTGRDVNGTVAIYGQVVDMNVSHITRTCVPVVIVDAYHILGAIVRSKAEWGF
jgi:hypothetical protein